MAPLYEGETNRHVAVEEISRRQNSWFSYFYNSVSYHVHQRKNEIASKMKDRLSTEDVTKTGGHVQEAKTLKSASCTCREESINKNQESKDNYITSNQKDSDITDVCKDSEISAIQKQSPCKNCKIEQKKQNLISVYKKKDSDRASKQSSFRAAVMDLSPEWFKSLMREPEFVMVGGKRAGHNE